jgi:hypothetical protein
VRKRKRRVKRPPNTSRTPLFDVTASPPDDAGEGDFSPEVMETFLASFVRVTDPVEAEVLGSMFLGAVGFFGVDMTAACRLVTAIEAAGDPRAAGMLAVLGALDEGPIGEAATAGLDRLQACGIVPPEWMAALSVPVTAHDCVGLSHDGGPALVLAACFDRAGIEHAMMLMVVSLDCGDADKIVLLDSPDLAGELAELRRNAKRDKVLLTPTALDPAEFRWQAEAMMDARDRRDRYKRAYSFDPNDLGDEDGPGYRCMAPLLRARLRALPLAGETEAAARRG